MSFSLFLLGVGFSIKTGLVLGGALARNGIPLLVLPLCLLAPMCRYHPFTGMDTTLAFTANALLILSTVHYCRRPVLRNIILLGFTAVLVVQARPDSGLYAFLFPLLYTGLKGKLPKGSAALFLGIFLGCNLMLLFLWKVLFGSYLPIPFYAKAGGFLQGYSGALSWNSAEFLLLFLRDSSPFILMALLFAGRKSIPAILSVLLPMAMTFLFFSRTIQVMGWFSRYYFPSMPFLILLAFESFSERTLPGRKRVLYGVAASAVFCFTVFFGPARATLSRRCTGQHGAAANHSPEPIPWWDCIQHISRLVGSLPPGIRMAATEHGYIAAENLHADIVDMAGLHEMDLARNGFSAEHILEQEPDLIWMPHWDYVLFRSLLEQNESFRRDYLFYPGVFNYGIALRKGSPLFETILEELGREFARAYPGEELIDYSTSSEG